MSKVVVNLQATYEQDLEGVSIANPVILELMERLQREMWLDCFGK